MKKVNVFSRLFVIFSFCVMVMTFGVVQASAQTNECTASFDYQSNTLHVPCFSMNNQSFWLDLALISFNPMELQLTNAGENVENITGTWHGTYSATHIATTSITFTLVQNGTTLSGTFFASNGASGNMQGTIDGSSISFSMTATSSCPGTYNGTATVSENMMNANFSGTDCLGYETGHASATKDATL